MYRHHHFSNIELGVGSPQTELRISMIFYVKFKKSEEGDLSYRERAFKARVKDRWEGEDGLGKGAQK